MNEKKQEIEILLKVREFFIASNIQSGEQCTGYTSAAQAV